MRTLPAILLIAFFCLASIAEAKKPPLDLKRADRAAQGMVDKRTTGIRDSYDSGDVDFTVTATQLDSCDRDSASRASCDATYSFSDGDQCDETIVVSTTRRNHLSVRGEDFVCDSDG